MSGIPSLKRVRRVFGLILFHMVIFYLLLKRKLTNILLRIQIVLIILGVPMPLPKSKHVAKAYEKRMKARVNEVYLLSLFLWVANGGEERPTYKMADAYVRADARRRERVYMMLHRLLTQDRIPPFPDM